MIFGCIAGLLLVDSKYGGRRCQLLVVLSSVQWAKSPQFADFADSHILGCLSMDVRVISHDMVVLSFSQRWTKDLMALSGNCYDGAAFGRCRFCREAHCVRKGNARESAGGLLSQRIKPNFVMLLVHDKKSADSPFEHLLHGLIKTGSNAVSVDNDIF